MDLSLFGSDKSRFGETHTLAAAEAVSDGLSGICHDRFALELPRRSGAETTALMNSRKFHVQDFKRDGDFTVKFK